MLSLLASLASSVVATEAEILLGIELHGLMGRGIGSTDAGLCCLGCAIPWRWSPSRRIA